MIDRFLYNIVHICAPMLHQAIIEINADLFEIR